MSGDFKRPAGHQFTPAEIQAMSLEEFRANEDSIMAQLSRLAKQRPANQVPNAKSVS